MATVRVRAATPEDAEAITRVYMESAEIHARLDPERNRVPERAAIEQRYRTSSQHPEAAVASITLVAELSDEICGFVDARLIDSFDRIDPMYKPATYCFIADIAVAEISRSRGAGEALMRAAEDWALEHRAHFVYLEYQVDNGRAAAFYERLGYRPSSNVVMKKLTPG